MNPHFIFNSLIAIQSFIYKSEPKEAGKYLPEGQHAAHGLVAIFGFGDDEARQKCDKNRLADKLADERTFACTGYLANAYFFCTLFATRCAQVHKVDAGKQ